MERGLDLKPLPIRLRLSIWYFAMFATAAGVLSFASWWMLQRSVNMAEYHELQERVQDVQLLLAHEPPHESDADLQQKLAAVYALKDDGKWLQILDQDGKWLFRSKRMLQQNPELPIPGKLPIDGVIAEFHQGTRFVRILGYPIAAGGRRYSVQTGIAMNKSMALLHTFGVSLLLLTPAVIALAALGGHWMSRKALQPVALLAMQARRIHDRNLDTRLPVPKADDEISDLSRTLNQMLERIDRAFASVRAFTGNASHELRTPIALLRTEIEVALYRPRHEEEYRSTLNRMHEETIRMTNLVENLLSLARADGGAEALMLEPIQVKGLFQRIEDVWKKPMKLAMLDFQIETIEEDAAVLGEPTSTVRLISILLENALKYTSPGGSVVLRSVISGQSVTISVRDTGIGIPAKDIPRIFDRFYRGQQPSVQGVRGSGLGLALGKWIAERQGTILHLESTPGHGSCFSFALALTVCVSTPELVLDE
jgi:signal transduction histidine kinase